MRFRSMFAAVSGNFVEWYDFALYLFLTPILAKNFFPSESGHYALLAALTMHAISFFFRPLGAVIFGHVGDVYGRRVALQISISVLSMISMVIAILPTYQQIGWLAPLLLCVCRMGQGICLGGEFAGSMIYLAESSNDQQRSLWSSMSNNGSNLGILTASASAALCSSFMGANVFADYGYRCLFFVGGLVGVLGFMLRTDLHETTSFQAIKQRLSSPVMHVFKFEKKRIIQLFFLLGVSAVGSYGLIGSVSIFLQQSLSLTISYALTFETGFIALTLIFVPFFATIADKISPQQLLKYACIGYLTMALPAFYLCYQFKQPFMLLPLILIYCMEQASLPAVMGSLFPPELRYTAVSLSYNASMAIIGGVSPLLGQLHARHQERSYSIAYLLMTSSLIALLLLPKLCQFRTPIFRDKLNQSEN